MTEDEFARWKLHDLIVKQYREVGGGEYGKDPSDDYSLLVETLGQVARHILPEAQAKLAEYNLSPEDVGLGAIVRRVNADRIELAGAKAESETRMKALESLRKTNQGLVFSYEDTKEKLSNVRSFVSSLEETIARQRDELNILRKVVDAKEPAKMRAKMRAKKVGRS